MDNDKKEIVKKCVSLGEYLASVGKNAAARHTFKKTLASPMVSASDKVEITQKLAKVDEKDRELNKAKVIYGISFEDPNKLQVSPAAHDLGMKMNSETYDKLREDIKERGIQIPLTLDGDGAVVCGANRLKVAQDLGLDKIPYMRYNSRNYSEIQRYALSDNLLRRQISKEDIKAWVIQLKILKGEVLPGKQVGRPKGGRGKKDPTSVREVAKVTGIPKSTVQDIVSESGQLPKSPKPKKLWVKEPDLLDMICKGKDLSRDKRFPYDIGEQVRGKVQHTLDQLEKGESLSIKVEIKTTENQ